MLKPPCFERDPDIMPSMQLPNGHLARVPRAKLVDYCLSPDHPEGRHKARVFLAALGATRAHAELLEAALLAAAAHQEVLSVRESEYGSHYVIDFEWELDARRAWIRSGWFVSRIGQTPTLTTCYVR